MICASPWQRMAASSINEGGYFGLAVPDYTHATAPNRRYADLITQRLIKAVIDGESAPYSVDELTQIAARCTEREKSPE